MATIEKKELLELEILKHVEETPRLNNRMAAAKLGCSIKLAHKLLKKMVTRGLLHVKIRHARRWDYFLTPKGIREKARLTYEFLDFSMHCYHEARKTSSQICRDVVEAGGRTIAFLGGGDMAEIVYLGVKEWGLELIAVYDDDVERFLDREVLPTAELATDTADAIIVCLYDSKNPKQEKFLPNGIESRNNFHWIF